METAVKTPTLQGQWQIDHAHSNLNFSVKHLVISTVRGSFERYEGQISNDGKSFEDAQLSFNIATDSINTKNEQRDAHLQSDDFFNAAEYPEISFRSSSIHPKGDDRYELRGELQIRDISREEVFELELGGLAEDGYGNTKLGLSAEARINRFDYGLKWHQLTEAGGATVGKEVKINVDFQFTKQ